MENDIIYFSDFPNLQETGTRKDNGKFDLTLLPTQELKEEFRGYIMYRCKNGTFRALIQDRTAYNHIAKFLNSRINRRIKSLGDRNPEKWISLLKGWMLEQGITIVKEKKSVYGTVSYGEAVTILYFRNVLKFLGPEDLRDEIEKDVWELKNLDIKIRSNPIYNVKTLDFRKIYQPDIREECKKAVYMNLQYEAIGTVQGELTIMRIFSEYLQKEYSKIKSCSEIDREVLEEFLIHLSTKDTSHSANSSYVISLRRQLETIGKIYSYERLEHLFINTDIPPEVNAEFRVYSDDEMKRLNAEITQMDVQIARCLLIHQMLGTRISDTLTGDRSALEEGYETLLETMTEIENRYNEEKGLVRAEQSTSNDAFPEPENAGYSLGSECYYMKAYDSMAKIEKLLHGENEKSKKWSKISEQLCEKIREEYWNDEAGYFTSGPKGSEAYENQIWETSGEEAALWDKFHIATPEQKREILNSGIHTAMTPYGIRLFPHRKEHNHFVGPVWPVWESGFASAAAESQNKELLLTMIAQQMRTAVLHKNFHEVLEADTGKSWRWPGQLWHACGFAAQILYGVFGISYDEQGMRFNPCVPEIFKEIEIQNLNYQSAKLTVKISGTGTVECVILDDEKVDFIPYSLTGNHIVHIKLTETESECI